MGVPVGAPVCHMRAASWRWGCWLGWPSPPCPEARNGWSWPFAPPVPVAPPAQPPPAGWSQGGVTGRGGSAAASFPARAPGMLVPCRAATLPTGGVACVGPGKQRSWGGGGGVGVLDGVVAMRRGGRRCGQPSPPHRANADPPCPPLTRGSETPTPHGRPSIVLDAAITPFGGRTRWLGCGRHGGGRTTSPPAAAVAVGHDAQAQAADAPVAQPAIYADAGRQETQHHRPKVFQLAANPRGNPGQVLCCRRRRPLSHQVASRRAAQAAANALAR